MSRPAAASTDRARRQICLGAALLPLASGGAVAQNAAVPVSVSVPTIADATAAALAKALVTELDQARRRYEVPAMTVAVWQDGVRIAAATRGVRDVGSTVAATDADQWHIGSCGKLMTAAMVLRLVDRGVLALDAPIDRALPKELGALMHSEFRRVTLAQLLSHRGGIVDVDLQSGILRHARGRFQHLSDAAQRQRWQAASIALEKPPAFAPGDVFEYSNLGYIVAGVAASHATGKSWQRLMRDEVFAPLGMASAGFGAPGPAGSVDQPRGHESQFKWLVLRETRAFAPGSPGADFPDYFGPAGLIHVNLADWNRFLQRVLLAPPDALLPQAFLSAGSLARLRTPNPAKVFAEYGLGVRVHPAKPGLGVVYEHTGSNGKWRAHFRVSPGRRRVIVLAANLGTDDIDRAFAGIAQTIERLLHAPIQPGAREAVKTL